MQPAQVTLNLGTPPGSPTRSSSEFEQVQYPVSHHSGNSWSQHEQLPLHYMANEETTRRRVRGIDSGDGKPGSIHSEIYQPYSPFDDQGKDVYSKSGPYRTPLTGGRPRKAYLPPPTNLTEFLQQNLDHLPPAIYTLLSCWTRFHKIGHSPIVVWDEAHFGKFGSHYLKREFYFDVHPPLGKMLVGLVGLLSGYDGHFGFESGAHYPDNVPYVAMRVLLALFGVLMVPLGWYTAVELGLSKRACHLTALMVLLDVGWLCISRFILLDSMLLFFTFLTVFCMTKFNNQQYQPFAPEWWFWLAATGFSIGWVSSVKWVGMFVTALVGAHTIEDLWRKFGDLRLSWREQAWHWGARVACLIVLPFCVYMSCFKIHFMILNHSGPGDAQMSSLFQANLVGNDFHKNPLEVAYGSRLTLKNMGWGGGLLHSHVQTYPVGSLQQQVTCYHYKDENNDWVILPRWDELPYNAAEPIKYIANGDVIRLQHASTTRNLHSHSIPAPVSKLNNEVSGYGNTTVGDLHDYWRVEVVDDLKRGPKQNVNRIHSLTTRLRFRHEAMGCYLRAANAILPQWGFKQVEVSCEKENNPKDVHTYWNVESHWNDRLPPGESRYYSSPFLRDFWHLNVAMMTSNNALIPDPDKEDILASKPTDWPFLNLGLRMCGWGDDQTKYYLLGTPVIWIGSSISLILSLFVAAVYLIRQQRKYKDFTPEEWDHFLYVGKVALVGWALHYVPFLIMGRVTYIHHYLPTLYFAVIMFVHLLDHFVFSARWLSERRKSITFYVCVTIIFANFWWFRGLAWGIDGPVKEHTGLLWRKSWNIYEQT